MGVLFRIKKRSLWLSAAVLVLAAAAAGVWRFRFGSGAEADAIAVGLRGASEVSKPLSGYQRQRLETHFLDIPPAAHTTGAANARAQVDQINRFNRRQQ